MPIFLAHIFTLIRSIDCYDRPMTQVTTTLKLKFFDLNRVKANMFEQTAAAATQLANELLRVPHSERKKLTTAQVVTPLKSALSNQVIRILKGKAGKRAKAFKVFWPEVNNQNWKVVKVGDTYSVSFPTVQGVKRVPIAVHGYFTQQLDDIINGDVEKGLSKADAATRRLVCDALYHSGRSQERKQKAYRR